MPAVPWFPECGSPWVPFACGVGWAKHQGPCRSDRFLASCNTMRLPRRTWRWRRRATAQAFFSGRGSVGLWPAPQLGRWRESKGFHVKSQTVRSVWTKSYLCGFVPVQKSRPELSCRRGTQPVSSRKGGVEVARP
jgi:hypothetical protein